SPIRASFWHSCYGFSMDPTRVVVVVVLALTFDRVPEWRNWQARGAQNAVPARACGFESHLRHQPPPADIFVSGQRAPPDRLPSGEGMTCPGIASDSEAGRLSRPPSSSTS